MKKILCLILFVASCLSVEAQYVGIPRKIVGPSGSKVDVSDGNVGINAGSGGAVNVTNGDVYVPTLINFSPCPSCAVSANPGASFRYNSSATRMEVSINGAAYVALGGGATISSTSNILKGDGAGNGVAATAGTDFPGLATANTFSVASAASTAAQIFTGAWFTGGTGTTTFPHLLLQAAGTTASTTWNTAGTAIGVNAVTGFTGNFVDYKLAGVTKARIDIGGTNISNAGFFMIAGPPVGFNQFGFDLGLNHPLYWSSSDSTGNNRDVAIVRNAAGVLEIDSSVAGTYRDLILRNITVGGSSGTQVKLIRSATATLDFTSTAAQTSAELSITLTGAVDGDDVIVSPPNGSNNANTCFTARVSAADTVQVKFNNFSSGAVDPASGTFRVSLVQF